MKLIKKSEKLLLEKIKIMEETEEENLQVDANDLQEPSGMQQPLMSEENTQPKYISWRDQPMIQSVGNSGWQVSDIWKDIRLDDFNDR
ncbi:hypothetical protein [Fortiea contorta]|uniref:hypothetical protein n=1 Tax=Fortiea contorta TaxID=1892405 RepID=UPI000347F489|nr:hypothetical protein [Fortiea contorta]